MGRKSTNNPRQIPSKRCRCARCTTKFRPGQKPTRRDCIGTWQARYVTPGGDERTKNWPTETEARSFLDRTRTQIRDRTWIDPKRAEIKLRELWSLWWPTQRSEPTTRDRDEALWRNHIAPHFGNWRICDIGHFDIQGWVNSLEAPAGPLASSSIPKVFQILDRMLRGAMLDRRLPFNPADGIKLPKIQPKHPEDKRPPTYAQLWRIRACLPDYHHALQIVAQETGLRWGELAGLRACWVDLDQRRIQVREVLTESRGKLRRKEYPKSNAGLRTVPLTGLAWRVLRDHIEEEKPSRNRSRPEAGLCPEELVFHGRNRKNREGEPYRAPLRRVAFRRLWIKAIQEAGVARTTVRTVTVTETSQDGRQRKVTKERVDWWPDFHDQRHALASKLHNLGVPEAVVQELLGHERAGAVTWLYTHAAADVAGQVLAALEDRRRGRGRPRLRAVS